MGPRRLTRLKDSQERGAESVLTAPGLPPPLDPKAGHGSELGVSILLSGSGTLIVHPYSLCRCGRWMFRRARWAGTSEDPPPKAAS